MVTGPNPAPALTVQPYKRKFIRSFQENGTVAFGHGMLAESSVLDVQPLMKGRNMKKATRNRARPPSRASLREMPEVDFTEAKTHRNPYAQRITSVGSSIHVVRGRPRKGSETGPTSPRSIRFPDAVWQTLERRAKAEGITLHAALRTAVLRWVEDGKHQ